jgi:hypothetical protein
MSDIAAPPGTALIFAAALHRGRLRERPPTLHFAYLDGFMEDVTGDSAP